MIVVSVLFASTVLAVGAFAWQTAREASAAGTQEDARAKRLAFLLAKEQGEYIVVHQERQKQKGYLYKVDQQELVLYLSVEMPPDSSDKPYRDLTQIDLRKVVTTQIISGDIDDGPYPRDSDSPDNDQQPTEDYDDSNPWVDS